MVNEMQDSTIQFKQMLSARQRAREGLITTLLWVVYGYLWLPLISFGAWYFGVDFAYDRVIRAGGPDELILLLLWFSIIFLIILLIVVTWSGFQYSRYNGDKDRRTAARDMDPKEELELWNIDASLQQQMKSSQVFTVSLDEDANIVAVHNFHNA